MDSGTKDSGTPGMRQAALAYLERGWSIIPVQPRGKRPLVKWEEFQERRATAQEVEAWFRQWPDANLGIVTGAVSGIVVIDLDGSEGQAAFEARFGIHETLTSESGRDGGRHCFFAHPGSSVVTRAKVLNHVDVRGDGGYVVAPPSLHPEGRRYQWSAAPNARPAPAQLTEGLLGLITKRDARTTAGHSPRVTAAELHTEVHEGERDDRLLRYAGSFVARGITGPALRDELLQINADHFHPPLTEHDVARIADSAERLEQSRPRKQKKRPSLIIEDLHSLEVQEVRWLWTNYIPLGAITVIDGLPGVGKSTLTIDLAARVSTGRAMPDGSPGLSGHVLLLNNEDMAAVTVKPRVVAAQGDDERIGVVKEVGSGEDKRLLLLPDDMQAIREGVVNNDTKLLVIDPIMGFLARDVNSYSDQHVRGALAPLALLAAEREMAVVLVRHPTKNRDRSALEAGGGSIGIIAAARSGFYVAENPRTKGEIIIASTKSNYAPTPTSLAFRLESDPNGRPRIRWEGPSDLTAQDLRPQLTRKTNRVGEAAEFLEEHLKDGPRSEKDVVAEAANRGISHSTLKRAKKRVGVVGQKRSFDGGWSWSLPTHSDQKDTNDKRLVLLGPGDDSEQGIGQPDAEEKKETNSLVRASFPDGTHGDDLRRAG